MTPEEEAITSTKSEIITLLDKLPVEQLKVIEQFAVNELKRLEPAVAEAESRLKSIWNHLTSSFEKGEHAVVNDVHEFLLGRANALSSTSVAPAAPHEPLPQSAAPQEAAPSTQDSHDQSPQAVS